ncbi:hypothetical protein JCM8097_003624 [Rhodosporidiobolus ruineniae]
MNAPAHTTKEVPLLLYTLPCGVQVDITQDCASPDSTGRTIWLGAQILSVYLHDALGRPSSSNGRRRRAIELGSGTGLLSLALASQGYDILATDVDMIVDGVLQQNVEANGEVIKRAGGGKVEAKVLDWFQPPGKWSWRRPGDTQEAGDPPLEPPFDLIVTADTVYEPSLSQPLLQTLHGLASLSPSAPIYLALESRDPSLVASFLSSALSDWNLKPTRVGHDRIRRLVERKEGTLGWEDEEVWEGVEVWKLKLGREKKARAKGGLP